MKRYTVFLTEDALLDFEDLAHFLTTHDGPQRAEQIGQLINKALRSLATLPNRGNHPQELLAIGNRTYREVHVKSWRIVYRVDGPQVVVHIIADGHRDMRALLTRRLLNA